MPGGLPRVVQLSKFCIDWCMTFGSCLDGLGVGVFRAKNFHSSARPRRVLSYLGRVDFQKHLSYGTSRVCLKKDALFY